MVKSVTQMLGEARASVAAEPASAVAEALAHGTAVVVDVRQRDEFARRRIPGSISVPRGLLEFLADPAGDRHQAELDPDRRVVVVSESGERAVLAAATLQSMGYLDVTVLEGGIAAWLAEGRPVAEHDRIAV